MYLTAYNVADYLISKGWITAESVVDGDFFLVETGRRNRNFKVLRNSAPGLFLKQVKTSDAGASSTLQREAAFYDMVKSASRFEALAKMAPPMRHYDAGRHVLVLDLIPNGESMAERQMRSGEFPESTAALLGDALASFHALGHEIAWDPNAQAIFPKTPPWILTIDQPGQTGALAQMGPIGAQLASALPMYPGLIPALGQLRAEWQYDSFIHGDMKWDNCMLVEDNGETTLRVIDWELSDLGDGAWDLATIFKEYLAIWLMSIRSPETAAAPAGIPGPLDLTSLQPSIRAFWNAYVTRRGLSAGAAHAYLRRSIRFCAARMIVAILEYLNGAPQLTPQGYAMLHVSHSLLLFPDNAQTNLLGIPTTSAYAAAH